MEDEAERDESQPWQEEPLDPTIELDPDLHKHEGRFLR